MTPAVQAYQDALERFNTAATQKRAAFLLAYPPGTRVEFMRHGLRRTRGVVMQVGASHPCSGESLYVRDDQDNGVWVPAADIVQPLELVQAGGAS